MFLFRYILFFIILICVKDACCQKFNAGNFKSINYTVEDGLPSDECHDIVKDSLGYLWIATDRGLVRYDGYEFKSYGINDGLKDLSCLELQIDHKQNLWIHTLSNKIYTKELKKDTLVPFKFQNRIDQYLKFVRINGFYVAKDDSYNFVLEGIGILEIDRFGNVNLNRGKAFDSLAVLFTKKYDEHLLLGYNNRLKEPDFKENYFNQSNTANQDEERKFELVLDSKIIQLKLINDQLNKRAFSLSDGVNFISLYGNQFLVRKDSITMQPNKSNFHKVNENEFGIFSLEMFRGGVKYYKDINSFSQDSYEYIIPNISASSMVIDSKSSIWIATLDEGIFHLTEKKISKLSLECCNKSKITSIERGPNGLYFNREAHTLFHLQEDKNVQKILIDSTFRLHGLERTFDNRLIVCKYESVLVNTKHTQKSIKYEPQSNSQKEEAFNVSLKGAYCFDKNDCICAHPHGIFVYSNLDSVQRYYSYPQLNSLRVLAAEKIAKGNYLLGTANGLKELKNEQIQRLDGCPELLNIRINSIQKWRDSYLFGTQGNGLVIWDLNSAPRQFTKKENIVSNIIEDIYISSKKNIYLCSKNGLSVLSLSDSAEIQIKNFTTFHGLPSNEVFDIEENNDTIYVATGKGIALLSQEDEIAKKHNVILEEVFNEANRFDLYSNNISIPYNQQNISVKYKTIDHTQKSHTEYRYNLNDNPWVYTNSTWANFTSLKSGEHQFNVQSKNIDNIWSQNTSFNFFIEAPWWNTKWAYLLYFLLVLGIALAVFKRRIRNIENKSMVERQIRDLEKSALQSQMNPHFIFNCLNSIQYFIINNNTNEAMEYLGQFAQLIRGNLNASRKSSISISEEIEMLNNYLSLEQLRLDNKFNFEIHVDEVIDTSVIKIPAMLIQPFVENAVIHGMNSLESGGIIKVDFKLIDDKIQILVIDNGTGIKTEHRSKSHKSLGMSITQRRLDFLTKGESPINRKSNENGTRIEIIIDLNKLTNTV